MMQVNKEQVINVLIDLIKSNELQFVDNNLVLGNGTKIPFPTTSPSTVTRLNKITNR